MKKFAGHLQKESIGKTLARLWSLAAGTLLVVLALFCAWQTWLIGMRSSQARMVHVAQQTVVSRLDTQLAAERGKVEAALKNPRIIADLEQNDAMGRTAAANQLALTVPRATVVFYSATLDEVVHANYDHFGYSRAAQLLAAQSSANPPPMQGAVNRGKVALTMARAVTDKDQTIGFAWVELPFDNARDVFESLDIGDGRLDLRLGEDSDGLLLYSIGRSNAIVPENAIGKPIAGTRLRVVAALPQAWIVLPGSLFAGIALTLACLGVGVLLLLQFMRSARAAERASDEEDGSTLGELSDRQAAAERAKASATEEAATVVDAPPKELDQSIFRAYDIRGVVGKSLDADVARLIGQAVGTMMRERELGEIVIGRDGRLSGPELAEALGEGLREAGVDVIDIGSVPTPLVYFATYHFNTGSGIAVTGSHNPPDYNGFKIVVGGETLSEGTIQEIYERIAGNQLRRGGLGNIRRLDVVGEYIDRIADDVQAERPLKVVVDAGNGIAGAIGPQVLQAIGCQVIPLYCEVDGQFPNHHPDPSDPENLQDLILSVKSMDADLGVAFDGDGDRLGVVTREGEIIYPDRLLMLFARDVLTRNPGATIIYDVKCTGHLQSDILNVGGSPLMWRTGHSLIKAKMRETEALLAGEMSGHFFFRERWYGFDDGIYAAARLMEIIASDPEERTPEAIFATLPKGVSTPELKIPMQEGEHYAFIEKFRQKAEFEGARLTTIDGLRADWKDGWGLVRASNTTPVLVLRFDADDEAALKRIQDAFRQQLLAVDSSLKLPF